jgi:hypothetical protein
MGEMLGIGNSLKISTVRNVLDESSSQNMRGKKKWKKKRKETARG